MNILDATTAAAVAAATSQQAQCEALIAAWSGGNVTARIFNGSTLLDTLTIAPFTIDTNADPREVVCGANVARTNAATGAPTRVVFRSGSTDIFEMTAGASGAQINFAGAIKALCAPKLAGGSAAVAFTANGGLPATSLPSWVAALPLWQWYSIPNTALSDCARATPGFFGDPTNKVDAWGSGAIRASDSMLFWGPNGGHSDYAGNEINTLNLGSEVPQWTEVRASSAVGDVYRETPIYADGRPSASHAYWMTHWIEPLQRYVMFCRGGISDPAFPLPPGGWPYPGNDSRSKSFNPATGDYDTPDYITPHPTLAGSDTALCFQHRGTGDVYISPEFNSTVGWTRWQASTNTWSKLSSSSRSPWRAGAACDHTRDRVLVVGGFSSITADIFDLSGNGLSVSFGGLGTAGFLLQAGDYPGVDYDDANDAYVTAGNSGAGVVELTTCTAGGLVVANPAVTGTKPANKNSGINRGFLYVPALKGFVLVNKFSENVKFIRTAV